MTGIILLLMFIAWLVYSAHRHWVEHKYPGEHK
jgi:hypothetical protein